MILCVGMAFFVPVGNIYADSGTINPWNALFPFTGDAWDMAGIKFGSDQNAPLFKRYPMWSYKFSTDIFSSTIGALAFLPVINQILSLCMQFMAGAAMLVIYISSMAFNYTGFEKIADAVGEFVKILTEKLFFGELFTVALFFLGISLLFSFGRNEDVAGKLLQVIANLIIALTILFNMQPIISGLIQLGKTGSDIVLQAYGTFGASTGKLKTYSSDPGKNAFLNISDRFFEYNLLIPWQFAEFGEYAPESQKGNWARPHQSWVYNKTKDQLTANANPVTEKLQDVANKLKEIGGFLREGWNKLAPGDKADIHAGDPILVSKSPAGIPFRFFVVFLTFTIGTAYGAFLLAISGTVVIAQILMFLLAIVSPLVFLIAMVPDYGGQALMGWVRAVLGAALYKIVVAQLLVALLLMQEAIYAATSNWLEAIFGQICLMMAFFALRKTFFGMFPALSMDMLKTVEDQLYDKGKQTAYQIKDTLIETGKTAALGAAAAAGVATGTPMLAQGLKQFGSGPLSKMLGAAAESAAERRSGESDDPMNSDRENPGEVPQPPPNQQYPQGGIDDGGNDDNGDSGGGGGGPRRGPTPDPTPQGGQQQPMPEGENQERLRTLRTRYQQETLFDVDNKGNPITGDEQTGESARLSRRGVVDTDWELGNGTPSTRTDVGTTFASGNATYSGGSAMNMSTPQTEYETNSRTNIQQTTQHVTSTPSTGHSVPTHFSGGSGSSHVPTSDSIVSRGSIPTPIQTGGVHTPSSGNVQQHITQQIHNHINKAGDVTHVTQNVKMPTQSSSSSSGIIQSPSSGGTHTREIIREGGSGGSGHIPNSSQPINVQVNPQQVTGAGNNTVNAGGLSNTNQTQQQNFNQTVNKTTQAQVNQQFQQMIDQEFNNEETVQIVERVTREVAGQSGANEAGSVAKNISVGEDGKKDKNDKKD